MRLQALNIQWRSQRRPYTALGLLLGVAALLCLAWVAEDYAQADAEWQTLQARQARLTRAAQAVKRAPAPNARTGRNSSGNSASGGSAATAGTPVRGELLSAAQIDAQLQQPWDALLHALEQPSMKNVALMGVDMQAGARSMHLVAESRTMADALAYVQQLGQSGTLKKIYLTGQEEKLAGTQKVLRFSLDASWGGSP